MDAIFVFEQLLNGLGYGLMLFLIAAGLTLVFGIMDTMNLAHGSLYMAGAYVAARVHEASGAFALAVAVAVGVTVAIAAVVEFVVIRRLYRRDHLVQVLATFGIILIADDAVKAIWGVAPLLASTPAALAGPVQLFEGLPYPSYRLLLIGAGLTVALGLYLLVNNTRIGMLVRAGQMKTANSALSATRPSTAGSRLATPPIPNSTRPPAETSSRRAAARRAPGLRWPATSRGRAMSSGPSPKARPMTSSGASRLNSLSPLGSWPEPWLNRSRAMGARVMTVPRSRAVRRSRVIIGERMSGER